MTNKPFDLDPHYSDIEDVELDVLVGKIMTAVELEKDKRALRFTTSDGKQYQLYHIQDCCEFVTLDDVCGDLTDLVGTPILLSECVTNNETPEDLTRPRGCPTEVDEWAEEDGCVYEESFTWSFYKFSTVKGSVTLRWYGESNGCYSETATLVEFIKEEEP